MPLHMTLQPNARTWILGPDRRIDQIKMYLLPDFPLSVSPPHFSTFSLGSWHPPVIAHLFHDLYFLFRPLYPTSSPSFPFHTLTTNDKTIEPDNIGTTWPSNTWWPKELPDRMLRHPKYIRRSVPHRPLPRQGPSPHQAGDSQEEPLRKPMPPLPA